MAASCVYFWYLLYLAVAYCFVYVSAIGCFKCTSVNRKNPDCEDRFNNTGKYYEENCHATRKGRTGWFPGTQCIKMIAEDASINFTVVVRNCVVDDGGTNSETEIGRESHCGWMRVLKYDGRRMRGCILSCGTDGCNAGSSIVPSGLWTFVGTLLAIPFHSLMMAWSVV